MTFDTDSFCRDHQIETADAGDKHFRDGWTNMPCPFCEGSDGFHLGCNEDGGYWNCWRCGSHNGTKAVRALLNLSWPEAKEVFLRYGGRPTSARVKEELDRPHAVKLPTGCEDMGPAHKSYLRGRGFDPEALTDEWGLLGTGPIGDYRWRIIAPIFHDSKLVSYQGRDIAGHTDLKYMACRKAEEVMDHKHTLYGLDKVRGHSVVVVEGVTDVWRLGPGAVATFGIEWTKEQAMLLKRFSQRFIMFDPDRAEAVRGAKKLAWWLAGFGGQAEFVLLDGEGDPGDLGDDEARELMVELIGGG